MGKTGHQCKLYYNTGTYGAPVWAELPLTRDLTLQTSKDEADASTRGGGGWKEYLQGLKDITIEFEMLYDPSDTAFAAMQSAYLNNTTVEVWALDGDSSTNGNQGPRFTAMVSGFETSQPLSDAVVTSVTLRPTPNADANPAWETVGS